jgi:hypothetical protein
MARRSILLAPVLFALGLLLVESIPAAAQSLAVPPRFYLAERVRPTFLAMLERSATFRRQCARIVEAGVMVTVAMENPFVMGTRMQARAAIIREGGQVKLARITLRADVSIAVHLAHELEHVIEQLDGVDLPKLAGGHQGEVWRTSADAFETRRARDTGLLVNQEMRQYRPPTILALRTATPTTAVTP